MLTLFILIIFVVLFMYFLRGAYNNNGERKAMIPLDNSVKMVSLRVMYVVSIIYLYTALIIKPNFPPSQQDLSRIIVIAVFFGIMFYIVSVPNRFNSRR